MSVVCDKRIDYTLVALCIGVTVAIFAPCIFIASFGSSDSWGVKLQESECFVASSAVPHAGKTMFLTAMIGTPPRMVGLAVSGSFCGVELWTNPLDSESSTFASQKRMSFGMDITTIGGRRMILPTRYSYRGGLPAVNVSSISGEGDFVSEHDHDYEDSDTGQWTGDPRNNIRGTLGVCPSVLGIWGIGNQYVARCSTLYIGTGCQSIIYNECDQDDVCSSPSHVHHQNPMQLKKSPWAATCEVESTRDDRKLHHNAVIDPLYSIDDGHRLWSHRNHEIYLSADGHDGTLISWGEGLEESNGDENNRIVVNDAGCSTIATKTDGISTIDAAAAAQSEVVRCEKCQWGREFMAISCIIAITTMLAIRVSDANIHIHALAYVASLSIYCASRFGTGSHENLVSISGLGHVSTDIATLVSIPIQGVLAFALLLVQYYTFDVVERKEHHCCIIAAKRASLLLMISMAFASCAHASLSEVEFMPCMVMRIGFSMAMVSTSIASIGICSRISGLAMIGSIVVSSITNALAFATATLPIIVAIMGGSVEVRLLSISIHACVSVIPALLIISRMMTEIDLCFIL